MYNCKFNRHLGFFLVIIANLPDPIQNKCYPLSNVPCLNSIPALAYKMTKPVLQLKNNNPHITLKMITHILEEREFDASQTSSPLTFTISDMTEFTIKILFAEFYSAK